MTNLAELFEKAADGTILFAVIGSRDESKQTSDKVMPWSEARLILDYEYVSALGGGLDCHKVYAWTESRVLFVHEYDEATSINWVPRNPVPCKPEFDGS